jgi:hypothetical protein
MNFNPFTSEYKSSIFVESQPMCEGKAGMPGNCSTKIKLHWFLIMITENFKGLLQHATLISVFE